eukprot:CCRYP_006338-RA/>CCRYP_006338-RA protein AED:0.18 eAED:0.17 QI:0/0/0/1/0.5/0.66/3/0/1616
MSPYPATRRNGTCTGSLWKSHSRGAISTSSSSGTPYKSPPSDDDTANSGFDDAPFSFDGILAEANERQRAHEFCVLVGNTMWSYSDVWAYAKGDSPTVSLFVVVHENTHGKFVFSRNVVSEIKIVGASAWHPSSITAKHTKPKPPSSPEQQSSLATEGITSPSSLSSKCVDFLIVTYAGTHVRCSAPTSSDRDEWLAALHAGLEGSFLENRIETLMVLSSGHLDREDCHEHQTQGYESTHRQTRSGKLVEAAIHHARSAYEAESSFKPLVPPPPQTEAKNARLARVKQFASQESDSYYFSTHDTNNSTTNYKTGYHSPCSDWSHPPSSTHCTSCGSYPPSHAMRIDAAPLPEYGMEVRVDLCHNCHVAQGVLRHVKYLGWLYEVDGRGRSALRMAWGVVKEVMRRVAKMQHENGEAEMMIEDEVKEEAHAKNGLTSLTFGSSKRVSVSESMEDVSLDDWDKFDGNNTIIDDMANAKSPKQGSESCSHATSVTAYTEALLEAVQSQKFAEYRRRSSALDTLCRNLERRGRGCAAEFIEAVEEAAKASASNCLYGLDHEWTDGNDLEFSHPKAEIGLKKEAFKVAGDMSAALKLLYDYALPTSKNASSDHADMLASILEFFLDLCDEGQLEAMAFFWPQLCHIHMQMLPPLDTVELIRVELVEDFLLTVATRYSVHLALDLVWGLIADLEESLCSSNCNSFSRRRRFAVLRFVSELESLLFDFEGGWGGGGVSLHGMLSPSEHQSVLLRDAMSILQLHRRFGSHYLTRSVRLDTLRSEALESLGDYPSSIDDRAKVKAQISRNAAYFSSHITFARKLGDIAEKLRFTELQKRPDTLKNDLKEMNASGRTLGGDPLNRLCGDGKLITTVHLPINEGHVFRSKERTPVLLLAEVIKKGPNESDIGLSSSTADQINVEETPQNSDPMADEKSDIEDDCSQTSRTSIEHDNNADDILVCPCTPPSPMKASLLDTSSESLGKLPHGVLAHTPKTVEATNVTEEGKVMMADMIANLIENEKHKGLLSPPLINDSVIDYSFTESTVQCSNDGHKSSTASTFAHASSSNNEKSKPMFSSPDQLVCTPSEMKREYAKKISALGSVFPSSTQDRSSGFSKSTGLHLTADSQFRRDVLFAIMERGMRGNNIIARGAATAARRAVQTMDRNRAMALMNETSGENDGANSRHARKMTAEEIIVESANSKTGGIIINAHIDDDEAMEALRLLIIQNRIAQENLSNENAVKNCLSGQSMDERDKGVDAGEVDSRLAGCGRISSSVLSALRLWKGGIVSNGELLELVQKDLQFLKQSAVFGSTDETKLIEDSKFWGRFSFGERWAEKKARLAASSPHGSLPGWDLIGCIVKSNDDLRQEAFVMQLIELCAEAFQTAGLDLWVHPYEIVATGRSTGIIECVRNAMSFDSLKKRPGYSTEGLLGHFQRMTEIAADPFKALKEAKQNFVSSLAAYSLMSYLFLFKDRHNGNLLLDTAGHVIHIDFGFVFGIAPGGSFSLEQSTPFKLTDEMLEVMGGLGSPLFSEFVTLFCCGFLALQAHADTFLTVVEITCKGSNFHCFDGKDPDEIVSKLRERFCPELNKSQTVAYALDLIKFATTSYGTKQYDYFQYLSQGIAT